MMYCLSRGKNWDSNKLSSRHGSLNYGEREEVKGKKRKNRTMHQQGTKTNWGGGQDSWVGKVEMKVKQRRHTKQSLNSLKIHLGSVLMPSEMKRWVD